MKISIRLLTACLLLFMALPQAALAGGDKGKDPYEVGEKYYAARDYRTALQYYRKALGQNDVRAHYRVGLIYEAQGRDRDALRHYRRFVDLGRPGPFRDDAVRRIRVVEQRLERETTGSAALLERGKSLFTEGKYQEAEEVLLRAAREDETNPEIHFYLGEVYMETGQYGKAEAEYRKAEEYY